MNSFLHRSIRGADTSRLSSIASQLRQHQGTLRYVDYRQAEKDCEKLGEMLLNIFSKHELQSFTYYSIPRGGIIILGILSYVLNLKPTQLLPASDPLRPHMIIDDISLTGTRLNQQLSLTPSETIVFAHLYSHPDLREAILSKESRVSHCVAAHDLIDCSREIYSDPEDYAAWQHRWSQRLELKHYWLGLTNLVGFAWSEPDRPFWNTDTKRLEDGWRYLPPHVCLKNKARLELPPSGKAKGQLCSSPGVVTGYFVDILWLIYISTGNIYSLSGMSADMWRAIVGYGSLDVAAEYLLTQYEIDAQTLQRDLRIFTEALLDKGLLVENSGQ